ncbi:DUF5107 domain-containing protein [Flavobacteriaceae bacterium F89]|uniref:DUF5107 domain-containing protein n=1 Tax=Cerina litoralis TaxID=2874477 RepID=A0AAE3JQA5_9FLAO|nr:DUF5107 domain-containing protein [Cerina litoralis]MCG2461654.1 DUF5107 domain-containing protein [Cerina litoralis]
MEVKVWESKITIPTYEIGPEDPNPSYFGSAWVYGRNYPYANQDDIGRTKNNREYIALYLENSYLRVLVLPELGSRIWSLYDKKGKREVWYRNNVVKPAEVGARGAWVSGGNELNFPANPPNEHSVTCFSPIDYEIRKNNNGSGTIIIGDIEKIQGMQWACYLTLYPDKAFLEQEAILFNRTNHPKIHIWFANASVQDEPDLRFIYPARSAYSAPEKIMTYPIHEGIDKSLARNIHHAQSIFVRGVRRDFFGTYFTKGNHGVVHVADYHEVPGKKIWHWGQGDDGQRWVDILTDPPSKQYAEIQSGRQTSEWDYEFLAPQKVEHLLEYWYPIRDMGNFVFANRELSINLEIISNDSKKTESLTIAVNATLHIKDANILVEADGSEIYCEKINLCPEEPYFKTITLQNPLPVSIPWVLSVFGDNKELIRYDTSELIDNNPNLLPFDEIDPSPAIMKGKSAELYVTEGLTYEGFKADIPLARELYRKALEIDSGYSKALFQLGKLEFLAGNYNLAGGYLKKALLRDRYNVGINYYLGLTNMKKNNLALAEDHLWVGVREENNTACLLALGQLMLSQAKYREAYKYLIRVIHIEANNFRAAFLASLALRKMGQILEAKILVTEKLSINPLDYFLNSELYFINKDLTDSSVKMTVAEKLTKFFERDVEICLSVQAEYSQLGFVEEGIHIMEFYLKHLAEAQDNAYPIIYYYLSYYLAEKGQEKKAIQYNDLAGRMPTDYVFPFRTETINVLQHALRLNPSDGRAHYYLGNLLFHKYRYDEGISEWEAAIKIEDNPVARRNLGQAYYKCHGNSEKAILHYQFAIRLNPFDYRYYCDFYDIAVKIEQTDLAFSIFQAAPDIVKSKSRFLSRYSALLLINGFYDRAIGILDSNEFIVMEGESNIHEIHVHAHLLKGWQLHLSGKGREAQIEYQRALTYPENQHVGQPVYANFSKIYFLIGLAFRSMEIEKEALEYWKKTTLESAIPMTYMDLVFGTEPSPHNEASYYKAMAHRMLGEEDQTKLLIDGLWTYCESIDSDDPEVLSQKYFLRGLVYKAKGLLGEADESFRKSLSFKADNLECIFGRVLK